VQAFTAGVHMHFDPIIREDVVVRMDKRMPAKENIDARMVDCQSLKCWMENPRYGQVKFDSGLADALYLHKLVAHHQLISCSRASQLKKSGDISLAMASLPRDTCTTVLPSASSVHTCPWHKVSCHAMIPWIWSALWNQEAKRMQTRHNYSVSLHGTLSCTTQTYC